MYLFEIKKLPKKADKAVLDWNKDVDFPSRDGKYIGMPNNPENLYFPLRNGKQFLIKCKDSRSDRMWFGGTDEEPFLVEMNSELISRYINSQGSINQLYRSLVPEKILELSEETGIKYKRQGDIFAARFCGEKYFEKNLAHILRSKIDEGTGNVFGTRHVARGLSVSVYDDINPNAYLFRGIIKAPDHKPLKLNDALYLLGQTKHIIHPADAD